MKSQVSRNSLAGKRNWGDGTASSTCIIDFPVNRLVNPVSNRGCHNSPTATSWTKQVHIKMLEQTLINQTCNRVLWCTGCITCTGALVLSTLVCSTLSDLTSISLPLHSSLPPTIHPRTTTQERTKKKKKFTLIWTCTFNKNPNLMITITGKRKAQFYGQNKNCEHKIPERPNKRKFTWIQEIKEFRTVTTPEK